MINLSLSDRYSGFAAALVAAVVFVSGSAMAGPIETRMTRCGTLNGLREQGGSNSELGKGVQLELMSECAHKEVELDQYKAPAESSSESILNNLPVDVADTSPAPAKVSESVDNTIESARGDINALWDACKRNGDRTRAACISSSSQHQARSAGLYSRLMGGMSGANLTNSCNSISGYTTEAQNAASSIRSVCGEYHSQCLKACNLANEVQIENRGSTPLSAWAPENRTAGFTQCAFIEEEIKKAENLVASNTANLQSACQAAQNQPAEKVAKEDDSGGSGRLLNQLAAAAPAIMSALSPAAPMPMYPSYGGGVDGGLQLNSNSGSSSSGYMPSVSKTNNGPASSNLRDLSMPFGGDMEMGTPDGYEKSKMSSVPQQPGGGGGGVGGSGGGAAAAGSNKRRAGGAKQDADVYAGYMSGGGAAGRFRPSPNDPSGGGGRRGGPSVVLPGQAGKGFLASSMDRFRPTWFARREIATVTGPDGITGPHTNMFRKVRIRYNEVPLGELSSFSVGK